MSRLSAVLVALLVSTVSGAVGAESQARPAYGGTPEIQHLDAVGTFHGVGPNGGLVINDRSVPVMDNPTIHGRQDIVSVEDLEVGDRIGVRTLDGSHRVAEIWVMPENVDTEGVEP